LSSKAFHKRGKQAGEEEGGREEESEGKAFGMMNGGEEGEVEEEG